MKRNDLKIVSFVAGVAALLVSGCGATRHDVAGPSWHLPLGVQTSVVLLADDDQAPDELVEFFDHDGDELKPREEPLFPEPRPVRRARTPGRPRGPRGARPADTSNRFGVRYGQLAVAAADYSWPSAGYFGLFARFPSRRTAFEVGGEFAELTTDDGASSTSLLFLRADFLMNIGGPTRLIVGALGAVETPDVGFGNEAIMGGFAHFGLAFHFGSFDVRWTYNENLASGDNNTQSYNDIAAGVSF